MKKGIFAFLLLIVISVVFFIVNGVGIPNTKTDNNEDAKNLMQKKSEKSNQAKTKSDVFTSDFEIEISKHTIEGISDEALEEKVKEFVLRAITKDFDENYIAENFHKNFIEWGMNQKQLDGITPLVFYIDRLGRMAEPESFYDVIVFETNQIRGPFEDYGKIKSLKLSNFTESRQSVTNLTKEEEQELLKKDNIYYIRDDGKLFGKGFSVKVTLFFENGKNYNFTLNYLEFQDPKINDFRYRHYLSED